VVAIVVLIHFTTHMTGPPQQWWSKVDTVAMSADSGHLVRLYR